MTGVGTPVIGEVASDTERFKERFQFEKHLILATPEHIGQDFSRPGAIAESGVWGLKKVAPPVEMKFKQKLSSTKEIRHARR